MKRVTKVVEHLRAEEIDARIKHCTEPWRSRRWHVIRCALVHLKPAAEIALEVGVARQTVHNLVAAYNRHGPQVLETPGHGHMLSTLPLNPNRLRDSSPLLIHIIPSEDSVVQLFACGAVPSRT